MTDKIPPEIIEYAYAVNDLKTIAIMLHDLNYPEIAKVTNGGIVKLGKLLDDYYTLKYTEEE